MTEIVRLIDRITFAFRIESVSLVGSKNAGTAGETQLTTTRCVQRISLTPFAFAKYTSIAKD